MISSSREADYRPKQEDKTSEGTNFNPLSGSTSWSRLKDPRIVRVSRAFGGKDRHSKVWTVKGLRDRRVRLSVPTAIQLYDLQNKLGLNQPSKVVDWLLNAAKHEIDELPPLQMPSGNLSQYHQAMIRASHEVNEFQSVVKSEGQVNWNDHSELSTYWSNSYANLRDHMKSKENVGATESKSKERLTNRKQHSGLDQGHNDAYTSTSNFFGRANQSNSQAGLLNNAIHIQNPSFLRWDRSNLSLSYAEDHPHHQNFNVEPIVPSTSLSTPNGSQFVVYPPAGEFDPKQVINFQMLSSTSTSPNSTISNPPINYSTSLHHKRSYHETIPFEHESL